MNKEQILSLFSPFRFGTRGGIGAFLTPKTDDEVLHRLSQLASGTPLSLQELNQLLVLAHEASVTRGFFEYYWLEKPEHTYDVTAIEGYRSTWFDPCPPEILSLEHLKWGLYRLYVDGPLYFGNVRTAFRQFRVMHKESLQNFFRQRRIDTNALMSRGQALTLKSIPKRNRHLVSEKAGKCLGSATDSDSEFRRSLLEAWHLHRCSGGARTSLGEMLRGDDVKRGLADRHGRTLFSASNLLDEFAENEQQIEEKCGRIASEYEMVRIAALRNTDLYLSMVNEMDVYVATSMREPANFVAMADFCEQIFESECLKTFKVRYFDPTMCAAQGHEDKGLTECLMVKCAKALVYCAGQSDSYGKDAEAAMALSLGKPVIFYCNDPEKRDFYRDIHPLSRLIEFETGVAVGAMVTESTDQVQELLSRLFTNKMQYKLEQDTQNIGYLRLIERLTNSVIRVQTNNDLLAETFWNHYHNR